jgi:hypothetical protein
MVRRSRAGRCALGALLAAVVAAASPAARAQEEDGGSRYGDAGTSEVSLLLGVSSGGFALGAGFRHFVVDAVAPGVETSFYRAHGTSQGFTFASVRVVPLRLSSVAFVLTGRGGRVYLSDHADGWAVGGDAGVLAFLSAHVGLEVGYEVLKLLPASFCSDLTSCVLHQPVFGLRVTF